MIQKTSQRQLNAVLASPARTGVDGPEEWGQWMHDRYYSLEVTQHPIRARMCGFGDKDRRPLAPAAVAKMVVRRQDNSILEVEEIDVDFFLVTVDLWSADGKQDMNLVLHPSAADRYVPPHAAKQRKRGPPSGPPRASPYPIPQDRARPPTTHPPGPSSDFTLRPIDPAPTPLLTQAPVYTPSAFPFPSPDPFADSPSPWPFPPPLERTPFHAPTLPSIHSLGRTSPSPLAFTDSGSMPFPPQDAADLSASFRGWGDAAAGLFDTDPALRDTGPTRWQTEPLMLPSLPGGDAWPSPVPAPQHTHHSFQAFGQTPVAAHRPLLPQHQPEEQSQREPGQHTIPPLPRHSYTRTLVGPLSANAQRLQDEHRKPGVFFLFQDLSIRTEGTFRLRMRLMNVGAPPAPNGLSNSVHTSVSPVLAQIFTEPFTVYSAKRFPGVPATSALSIAFGNQGQKLPLRNRHGAGKQPRRDPQPGAASSDEESS